MLCEGILIRRNEIRKLDIDPPTGQAAVIDMSTGGEIDYAAENIIQIGSQGEYRIITAGRIDQVAGGGAKRNRRHALGAARIKILQWAARRITL